MDTKLCTGPCGQEKPITDFHRDKHLQSGFRGQCKDCVGGRGKFYYQTHREERLAAAVRRWVEIKKQVIDGYGGKCICCGEIEFHFLTLDHVHNDGNRRRTEIAERSNALYIRVIKERFPSEYQLLCRNCNWGKYANGGTCPHQMTQAVGA